MKQIFLTKEDIAYSIFKTCVQRRKDHFGLFLNIHVVEEVKMLIKLIAVDSNHFIRYKCKITHCLDSQTLSEYISRIILDDNAKRSINEVLEVLIGVGTFSSTSSVDVESLQIVTVNRFKKSMPGGWQLFTFYLLIPFTVYFLSEFEATSHNAMLVGGWGKLIYP